MAADHVLIDPRWLRDYAEVLADLPAFLIGVRCPLDVVKQREKDRGHRTLGRARQQYDRIHAHRTYDLDIDTSLAGAWACAGPLKAFLNSKPRPHAFDALRRKG